MLILVACGQNDQHKQEDKQSNQSDSNSKEHSYKRIVSLMPSNTEILYELGLGKDIVGVSTVDDYPKDVKKGKKQFDTMNLNKEALLKVKPDLILAHESQKGTSKKVLDSLEKNGVKVVYVKDAQSLDQTYETFKQIGKVTGREHEANELVDETKHNVEKVIKSVPRHHRSQSVFMEVSSKPEIYTAGKHTFFDDMLAQLDAKNSFSNIEGWKPVDKESIIKKNPDILISTEGLSKSDYYKVIKKRDGFRQIKAVKNGRIETVNGDEISRPGPRIDEGLKQLRDAIYKR
ncbi:MULTISPECIES: ABC transporter substrate-binding protein [Staphylococcus]|uniref:ABC transporter substrate-binding protein n=2 Tax=Staphylococcus haemolyticus TaxID=1283 RepID=A0ABU3IJI9_STAHA|nr:MULTISPECIES: ABC transporter substrate-binding protein [Staphylococcus]MDU2097939.1 ABC transporter substrate-binding protein [Staphylococcus sp.]AMW24670.1 Vitamin B12 ABC transporter substrate-binding protein [Staphylococcus haemolyticus]KQC18790.1 Vitamin B12 ABC transporter substrate-binding protein [Staphylococcus haemolyticus]MBC3014925.1 ABC transporter substrate-binding protein [Staphylococcus haemolyticus]MBC3102652.1 ABC transporter substrate-binding protein [Staphylococcus haemo